MEIELIKHLEKQGADRYAGFTRYQESINPDALSDDWLDNKTSYIWKVGVLTIIDNNKADWIYVAIGTQRTPRANPEVIGYLHFRHGENHDPARVIERAVKMLADMHPQFID